MFTFTFPAQSIVFLLSTYLFASGNSTTEVRQFDPKIYNGYPAEIANTKHQVSIRAKFIDSFIFGLGHICGGSLISPSIVLTAAHCMRDATNQPLNSTQLVVAMGTLWRNVRTEETLLYNVSYYVSHRNYNRTEISYDIAFIVLDGEVPANHPTVQPIALVDSPMPESTLCQVTGWGYTEENAPSDQLMSVDVPIIDINVCNQGYEGVLKKIGQICAGYMTGGKDACSGDSGGPLVCNGKLTGIVSFGEGCARENKPGIYSDVLFFQDWIQKLNLERQLASLQVKCESTKIKELSFVTILLIAILSNVVK